MLRSIKEEICESDPERKLEKFEQQLKASVT